MPRQPLIVGNPVLMVIDIQKSAFQTMENRPIPHMPGWQENIARARSVVDAAHDNDIPVIFFQEIHRRDMVDFGRELDGDEDVHCMEDNPGTPVAAEEMDMRETDYFVHKRRYSCFFGTETEILLKGLRAQTLILVGCQTDVCVHYTFVDAHQHDYHCRVVQDCVGGSSPEAHQASLNAMEYLQTGALQNAGAIITAMGSWQRTAA